MFNQTIKEFRDEFKSAVKVTSQWIDDYAIYQQKQLQNQKEYSLSTNHKVSNEIKPNLMQREALVNIANLRSKGKNKALLISATGTGKTYLSAFDVKAFQAKEISFSCSSPNYRRKIHESLQRNLR